MKIQPRNIESFVKSPDANVLAILVYGPDEGLVRERVKTLGKTVVDDLNDPFNAVDMSAGTLKDDPASLTDEACAMSMMGGKRFIRIRDAGDKITKIFKEFLKSDPKCDALIVVEASDLGPRSSLRLLFEKTNNMAAIPCYAEDERGLSRFIQMTLRESGFDISPDALQFMSANLVGNRAIARNEVEKICTYMHSAEQKQITLDDILLSTPNNAAMSLDEIARFTASGQTTELDRTLGQMFAEGIAPVAILRATQNYFRRLHVTKARIESGINFDMASKKLQPPLFFKVKPAFENQLRNWTLAQLSLALEKLNETEAEVKKTGSPAQTLCHRVLFALSRIGNRRRRSA